jgi:hypothetical protein
MTLAACWARCEIISWVTGYRMYSLRSCLFEAIMIDLTLIGVGQFVTDNVSRGDVRTFIGGRVDKVMRLNTAAWRRRL